MIINIRLSYIRYIGLICLLCAYSIVGALLFQYIEAPEQERRQHRRDLNENDVAVKVANEVTTMIKNCTNVNDTECTDQLQQILLHYYRSTRSSTDYNYDSNIENETKWTLVNAILYAGSTYTTIGYGHITCKTRVGQMVSILYALAGIPLVLNVLLDISRFMYKHTHLLHTHVQELYDKRKQSMVSTNTEDYHPEQMMPVHIALIIMIGYILLCGALFTILNPDWDYWTSVYFFFISLSTIGYGDVRPSTPTNAIIAFLLVLFGLSLVSMCMSVIQVRTGQLISDVVSRFATKSNENPDCGYEDYRVQSEPTPRLRSRETATVSKESDSSSLLTVPGQITRHCSPERISTCSRGAKISIQVNYDIPIQTPSRKISTYVPTISMGLFRLQDDTASLETEGRKYATGSRRRRSHSLDDLLEPRAVQRSRSNQQGIRKTGITTLETIVDE